MKTKRLGQIAEEQREERENDICITFESEKSRHEKSCAEQAKIVDHVRLFERPFFKF